MIHILYNPLAGSGRSEEKAREAAALLPHEKPKFWISPRWMRPPL